MATFEYFRFLNVLATVTVQMWEAPAVQARCSYIQTDRQTDRFLLGSTWKTKHQWRRLNFQDWSSCQGVTTQILLPFRVLCYQGVRKCAHSSFAAMDTLNKIAAKRVLGLGRCCCYQAGRRRKRKVAAKVLPCEPWDISKKTLNSGEKELLDDLWHAANIY